MKPRVLRQSLQPYDTLSRSANSPTSLTGSPTTNHKSKCPRLILRLIDRAIGLRKHCADWFQKKAVTEEGISDNSKHWHFITVLESVLQILEPKSASESTDSAHQTKISTPSTNATKSERELDQLANIYEILYIDDDATSETAIPTEKEASRQNTSSQPPNVIYEAETTEEEVYFALYCFCDDLDLLRQFLWNLWQQYDEGKLNLMAVSVTTNTAINLAAYGGTIPCCHIPDSQVI